MPSGTKSQNISEVATSFRFSTEILQRLGEELNPNAHQGILELVKNAYDADARKCKVTVQSGEAGGGQIVVEDDGYGMTADQIRDGWLVLGRSSKAALARTPLGRIPAGSKGLGRLAALRLGDFATLETWPVNDPQHYYTLKVDWTRFDKANIVEDVALTIERHKRPKGQSRRGTTIAISRLSQRVGRVEIKRLARALILLADPFGETANSFKPELESPEYEDLAKRVKNKYFADARFHLVAGVDEAGRASARLYQSGNEIFAAGHDEIAPAARGKAPYECPVAKFELWNFILNAESFSGKVSLTDVRNWLGEFGGIHVYENGLRVSPYGEPSDDWLGMNVRRAASPEERPSTNTSIGRVSVERVERQLIQKTDRSGYIENHAFLELREFARDAMEWMARCRLSLREAKREKTKKVAKKVVRRAKKQVEEAINEAPANKRQALRDAVESLDRAHSKRIMALRRELQLYRTLSTAGIMAAIFSHETRGRSLKLIDLALSNIDRKVKDLSGDYDATFRRPFERARAALSSLFRIGEVTLGLLASDKRRVTRTDVHETVRSLLENLKPYLDLHKIQVTLSLDAEDCAIRSSTAAVEVIVANLLTNSAAAFEAGETVEKVVDFQTSVVGSHLVLNVADNGPGIRDIAIKDIWLPGLSTRPNGTGLGLTIVKDTVADLEGSINVTPNGRLGGAEFACRIPLAKGTRHASR